MGSEVKFCKYHGVFHPVDQFGYYSGRTDKRLPSCNKAYAEQKRTKRAERRRQGGVLHDVADLYLTLLRTQAPKSPLKAADLRAILAEQNFCDPLTGTAFPLPPEPWLFQGYEAWVSTLDKKQRPYVPELCRITADQGFVAGNVIFLTRVTARAAEAHGSLARYRKCMQSPALRVVAATPEAIAARIAHQQRQQRGENQRLQQEAIERDPQGRIARRVRRKRRRGQRKQQKQQVESE